MKSDLKTRHGGKILADEHQHRRRVLERSVHADRAVGGARPARNEQHPGLTRELGPGLGHVGGAAFLAADDEIQPALQVVQAIEHRQEALAGHPEGGAHAMPGKRIGEDAAAVARFQVAFHRRDKDFVTLRL